MADSPHLHPRQEFQRTVGFALYTDVNDVLMQRMEAAPIRQLPSGSNDTEHYYALTKDFKKVALNNPAAFGLYAVADLIVKDVPKIGELRASYGVTERDMSEADPYTFDHGFGDMDFPWRFPAVLANEVADFFISQGKMTQEQKSQFTLHDWASMIGSGWFGRLVHTMALADNETYGGFGRDFEHYAATSLRRKLRNRTIIGYDDELLAYKELYEPTDNRVHASATLSKAAINGLRHTIQKRFSTSVGCPVARYSVLIGRDVVEHNAHIQNLLARGTLRVVTERSNDTHVRLVQDWSAIDKTLALFAAQLDYYATAYGTPYAQPHKYGVCLEHERRNPLDILSWPAENQQPTSQIPRAAQPDTQWRGRDCA